MSSGAFTWRMCDGKHRHTKEVAEKRAAHKGINAYECPVCGYWHVGARHKGRNGRLMRRRGV